MLLSLTLAHFPTAEPLHGTSGSAIVHLPDVGTLVVTPETDTDGSPFHLLGFYPGDSWETGEIAATFAELHRTTEQVVGMLRYLAAPPEGVDHAAWIDQRLEDDGPDADAPTLPAAAVADLAHYRAEGGRFDTVTWWERYAPHYAAIAAEDAEEADS